MESAYKGRDLCSKRSDHPELIYTRIPSECDTNTHGFRGSDYGYDKKNGVFRIVVIGDSVAEGQGVDYQDRFAQVLERNLNRLTEEKGGEEKNQASGGSCYLQIHPRSNRIFLSSIGRHFLVKCNAI